jgi:hypothetical protein
MRTRYYAATIIFCSLFTGCRSSLTSDDLAYKRFQWTDFRYNGRPLGMPRAVLREIKRTPEPTNIFERINYLSPEDALHRIFEQDLVLTVGFRKDSLEYSLYSSDSVKEEVLAFRLKARNRLRVHFEPDVARTFKLRRLADSQIVARLRVIYPRIRLRFREIGDEFLTD